MADKNKGEAKVTFNIKNMKADKVLEIRDANPNPGAHVVINPLSSTKLPNQMWYYDSQNVIRSFLNDYAMEPSSGDGKIKMMPFSSKSSQMWTFNGNGVVNNKGQHLDLEDQSIDDNTEVIGTSAAPLTPTQNWIKGDAHDKK